MRSNNNPLYSSSSAKPFAVKAKAVAVKTETPTKKKREGKKMKVALLLTYSDGKQSTHKRSLPVCSNDRQFLRYVFSTLKLEQVESLYSLSALFVPLTGEPVPAFLAARVALDNLSSWGTYDFRCPGDIGKLSADECASEKIKQDWVEEKRSSKKLARVIENEKSFNSDTWMDAMKNLTI